VVKLKPYLGGFNRAGREEKEFIASLLHTVRQAWGLTHVRGKWNQESLLFLLW
jgi:hypothetical protein